MTSSTNRPFLFLAICCSNAHRDVLKSASAYRTPIFCGKRIHRHGDSQRVSCDIHRGLRLLIEILWRYTYDRCLDIVSVRAIVCAGNRLGGNFCICPDCHMLGPERPASESGRSQVLSGHSRNPSLALFLWYGLELEVRDDAQ